MIEKHRWSPKWLKLLNDNKEVLGQDRHQRLQRSVLRFFAEEPITTEAIQTLKNDVAGIPQQDRINGLGTFVHQVLALPSGYHENILDRCIVDFDGVAREAKNLPVIRHKSEQATIQQVISPVGFCDYAFFALDTWDRMIQDVFYRMKRFRSDDDFSEQELCQLAYNTVEKLRFDASANPVASTAILGITVQHQRRVVNVSVGNVVSILVEKQDGRWVATCLSKATDDEQLSGNKPPSISIVDAKKSQQAFVLNITPTLYEAMNETDIADFFSKRGLLGNPAKALLQEAFLRGANCALAAAYTPVIYKNNEMIFSSFIQGVDGNTCANAVDECGVEVFEKQAKEAGKSVQRVDASLQYLLQPIDLIIENNKDKKQLKKALLAFKYQIKREVVSLANRRFFRPSNADIRYGKLGVMVNTLARTVNIVLDPDLDDDVKQAAIAALQEKAGMSIYEKFARVLAVIVSILLGMVGGAVLGAYSGLAAAPIAGVPLGVAIGAASGGIAMGFLAAWYFFGDDDTVTPVVELSRQLAPKAG